MLETITKALEYLASVCDGAETQDAKGFNKPDSHFGKVMAARETALTPGQQEQAIEMLQKYRKQLEQAGIALPQTDAYQVVKTNTTETEVKLHLNSEIVIEFSYDDKLVDICRGLSKRRFDGSTKNWVSPLSILDEVKLAFPGAIILGKAEKLKLVAPPQKIQQKQVGTITLDNGNVVIGLPKNIPSNEFYSLLDKTKSLSERHWNRKEKFWYAPKRIAQEVVDKFPEFEVASEVTVLIAKEQKLSSIANSSSSTFEVPGIKGKMLPYQKAGAQFLEIAEGRAIIADQMGLGKTLQSLAYIQLHPSKRPVVIIVPASLKINWQREIEKWLSTDEKVHIIGGRKPYSIPADTTIVIVNYDLVGVCKKAKPEEEKDRYPWVEVLLALSPQILIIDEAHYCKNAQAKRSKAVKLMAEEIEGVILLTGTPITNRPAELFPLLNMVDPAAWPNFFKFAKRYCNAHRTAFGWDFSGASNLRELNGKIKPYVVRRTKDQVLKELPAKRRATIQVEMPAKKRREYDRLIREAREAIEEARDAGEPLGAQHLVLIEKAKQAAVRGKMKQAKDWIRDCLESNEKLLIFAMHKFVVAELMETFGKVAVKVTGDDNQIVRQSAVDRFQNNENIRLFVGNIKAAGVGLNLTAASNVAFLEFAWTPADMEQAEDRAHRIGQTGSVTAWYLAATGTIDEKIIRLLEDKRQVIDQVTDGVEGELKFSILNELADEIIKAKVPQA